MTGRGECRIRKVVGFGAFGQAKKRIGHAELHISSLWRWTGAGRLRGRLCPKPFKENGVLARPAPRRTAATYSRITRCSRFGGVAGDGSPFSSQARPAAGESGRCAEAGFCTGANFAVRPRWIVAIRAAGARFRAQAVVHRAAGRAALAREVGIAACAGAGNRAQLWCDDVRCSVIGLRVCASVLRCGRVDLRIGRDHARGGVRLALPRGASQVRRRGSIGHAVAIAIRLARGSVEDVQQRIGVGLG